MASPTIKIRLGTDGVSRVQSELQGLLGRVRGWAVGVGGALTAALGARELIQTFRQIAIEIDKVGANAQRLGIAAESLSTLRYAAQLAKTDGDKLEQSVGKLARSIYEAHAGVQTYARAFVDAGVAVTDAEGRLKGTEPILMELADAFSAMADGPRKTALAMQLMGRSGADMIPMLSMGSQAIREMQQEAREFGLEVSGSTAQAAGDFNDNLDRLRSAGRGLFYQLANELLPALVEVTDMLVNMSKQAQELRWVGDLLAKVIRFLNIVVTAGVQAFRLLVAVWEMAVNELNLWIFALDRFSRAFASMAEGVRASVRDMIQSLSGLGEVMALVFQGRFLEARVRASVLLGELSVKTDALVEDTLKSTSALKQAWAETTQYAAEVIAQNQAIWDQAQKGVTGALLGSMMPAGAGPIRVPTAATSAAEPSPALLARTRAKLELDEDSNRLASQRLALQEQISRTEFSLGMSQTERWRQTLEFRREELALIDEAIAKLQERFRLEEDDQTRQQIASQMRGLERDRSGAAMGIDRQLSQGDPSSFVDQFAVKFQELSDRLGTLAQGAAQTFADAMGAAVDGIAQGIEGLINRTMTWGQVLRHIGQAVVSQLIASFARMAAEFIVQQVLMRGAMLVTSALMTALGVKQKAQHAETTATGLTAGVGQSAAEGGWVGVLIYLGVVAAAMAAVAAMAGGFAQGGLVTGPGGPKSDSVLARLSAGEYVMTADAVRHYGEPMLAALNARALPTADDVGGGVGTAISAPTSDSAPAAASRMNLVLVDRRNQAREFLESSDGEARIVDIIRRHRLEIG